MAVITLGSGSTFKALTAEGLLLEVITYLQNQELNISTNSFNKDFIKLSYNLDTMIAVGSFAIPAIQSIDANGQITIAGSDYLENITFTPGDGGTFKSLTLSQYFLEIVAYLQIKENNPTANPQTENNVFSSYDGDEKTFSGTINLPLLVSFNDTGNPIITAKEYLL
ncbi:MAG: hypothetical protein ACR2LR_13025 [Hassallia sp.]